MVVGVAWYVDRGRDNMGFGGGKVLTNIHNADKPLHKLKSIYYSSQPIHNPNTNMHNSILLGTKCSQLK
jgi:hypothetical protein